MWRQRGKIPRHTFRLPGVQQATHTCAVGLPPFFSRGAQRTEPPVLGDTVTEPFQCLLSCFLVLSLSTNRLFLPLFPFVACVCRNLTAFSPFPSLSSSFSPCLSSLTALLPSPSPPQSSLSSASVTVSLVSLSSRHVRVSPVVLLLPSVAPPCSLASRLPPSSPFFPPLLSLEMGNALLPLLCYHTRGFFARDGVYRDASSRFPYLSLCFTEPVLQASLFGLSSLALFLLHPLLLGTAPPFSVSRSSSLSSLPFLSETVSSLPACASAALEAAGLFLSYLPAYLRAAYAPIDRLFFAPVARLLLPPRLQLCPCLAFCSHAFFLVLCLLLWFLLLRRLAAGFRLPAKPSAPTGLCSLLRRDICLLRPQVSPDAVPAGREAGQKAFASFREFAAFFSTRAIVSSAFPPVARPVALQAFLPLQGRRVIVTGGNAGIGRETARQLALWGAHVLIGCRDVEEGRRVAAEIEKEVAALSASASESESAQLGRVSVGHLDLCAFASVRAFAAHALLVFENSLDILVNNAGVMMINELAVVDDCGFEKQFVTNHLGHFLLTLLLLPALKAAARSSSSASNSRRFGRVINVASCAHVWHAKNFRILDAACTPDGAASAAEALGKPLETLQGCPPVSPLSYDKRQAYGNSKLANIWFTKELQRRLIAEARMDSLGRDDAASASENEAASAVGNEAASAGGNEAASAAVGNEASRCGLLRSSQVADRSEEKGEVTAQLLPAGTVGVYAVHPGSVHTKLMRHMVENRPLQGLLVNALLAQTVMKTARDGAATQLLLCLADQCVLLPGGFYADGGPSWVDPAANDEERMKELWDVSEVLCFGGTGRQTYVK
ncbi:oxidoreductase, short chain dehydrogenase/reductase family protein [Toxoplasma gondii ME49]|uniref:Oxidoreductase, short chain dehydrogenase/reductase family protein n=3 Tax=Toxoplasma gondii TaxID=5811 RepID=A0A125YR71_TOXGV|nr:oxidoreductase, short chain dehydrogenase/reductase family protein [Toxoplasma gondii ME49]EPT26290.1 oxidoreductase, short chain dehydrogenase/reductase family protein [Toxoplasma gondii ME49]ESS34750.1 oxidoreductase, short chain dehydrogenase/reductase family protein [Toxoplasma gondii VEG]|eukprot:XP_018635620.1 oxidoreductase, short chain dehydrogenase/reductase family protein [Toxoplasma gondii ME49]